MPVSTSPARLKITPRQEKKGVKRGEASRHVSKAVFFHIGASSDGRGDSRHIQLHSPHSRLRARAPSITEVLGHVLAETRKEGGRGRPWWKVAQRFGDNNGRGVGGEKDELDEEAMSGVEADAADGRRVDASKTAWRVGGEGGRGDKHVSLEKYTKMKD